MNKIKILLYSALIALLVPFSSCKDEDLIPVPQWETGVHGFGAFSASSPKNFTLGNMSTPVTFDFNWVSIDNANKVVKIEFFLVMSEKFTDKDKLVRTVTHGSARKFKTVEGSTVPGNRAKLNFNVTPEEVYNVFKDLTFDYGFGDGPVKVFENPRKPQRTAAARFTADDRFTISWSLTTEDGRYFDTWAEDNICGGEFPGANCRVSWSVK